MHYDFTINRREGLCLSVVHGWSVVRFRDRRAIEWCERYGNDFDRLARRFMQSRDIETTAENLRMFRQYFTLDEIDNVQDLKEATQRVRECLGNIFR